MHGPYTQPCTRPINGRAHGLYPAVYTVVYTSVDTVDPCTQPVVGGVHSRPCTRPCTRIRPVYKARTRAVSSPRNRCHPPPPPVDEAPSRSQVDEPSTRRRLRSVPPPPLRPLTRRLNAFCSIASTCLLRNKFPFAGSRRLQLYVKIFSGVNFLNLDEFVDELINGLI